MLELFHGNSDNERDILRKGYYYSRFCGDELQSAREFYYALYSAIMQQRESFSVVWEKADENADKDILRRFLFMVLADHPKFFYVYWEKTSYSIYDEFAEIKFKYVFSKEECLSLQKEIEKKVSYLTLVAKCFCGKNEEQLIKYLYCYFVEHMSYAGNSLKSKNEKEQCRIHSVVGSLLDERAVCDGIARGFKLLLDEIGIESWTIRRDINADMEFAHEWNVLKLNGEILHMDITWEMDLYSLKKQVMYKYFLLTEENMQEKHQNICF